MRFTLNFSLLIAGASAALAANCPPKPVTPAEQKAVFDSFVDAFYVKKNVTQAFLHYADESYIQHNPDFPSGRDVALNGLKDILPTFKLTVYKTSLSNDHGWVFFKEEEPGAKSYRAVVDIVRFNGSCIMEHWDVMQTRPDSPKNPLAFFDGQKLE
jgi:predicted SnoaL-like aldol condensation-catalyzing enzyme